MKMESRLATCKNFLMKASATVKRIYFYCALIRAWSSTRSCEFKSRLIKHYFSRDYVHLFSIAVNRDSIKCVSTLIPCLRLIGTWSRSYSAHLAILHASMELSGSRLPTFTLARNSRQFARVVSSLAIKTT